MTTLLEYEKLDVGDLHEIGKYFDSPRDFVNLIRTNRKFKYLITYYKYNPISDYEIFDSMQTQHIYKEEDLYNVKDYMHEYVIEHNVLNNNQRFEKEMDLYITQKSRLWEIYVAIPKGIVEETYSTENPINIKNEDLVICAMFTNKFFSNPEYIDNPMLIKPNILESLSSNETKKIYNSIAKMKKSFQRDISYYYKHLKTKDMIYYSDEGYNDEDNDFLMIQLDLDTGLESGEIIKFDHSYVSIDNIVLQEESFPKALKKIKNLNFFDIVYDTYENPVETVNGYTYHIDTLDAKKQLIYENSHIYCEMSYLGRKKHVLFCKFEQRGTEPLFQGCYKYNGEDFISTNDYGIDDEPDILLRFFTFDEDDTSEDGELFRKRYHSCFYNPNLKKWCAYLSYNHEISSIITRLIILRFNESRLIKRLNQNQNLSKDEIDKKVLNFKYNNQLVNYYEYSHGSESENEYEKEYGIEYD